MSKYGVKVKWVRDPITGKRHRYLEGEEVTVKTKFMATQKLLDEIVNFYMQGNTIAEISKMDGMPRHSIIYHWIQKNAAFKQRMKEARELRGLYFEEKAIESAREAVDKDDTPAARLRFDAYKWAAEVSDGLTYGKKTTIQGNPDQPLQIIVSTGFPEPNSHQKPPELGEDGLIKKPVKDVPSEDT